MRLRGSLGGRLLFATKYLPWEQVAATWISAILGLVRSTRRVGWAAGRERMSIMLQHVRSIPALLRERRDFYVELGLSSREYTKRMTLIR
jgi:hypothetical protein